MTETNIHDIEIHDIEFNIIENQFNGDSSCAKEPTEEEYKAARQKEFEDWYEGMTAKYKCDPDDDIINNYYTTNNIFEGMPPAPGDTNLNSTKPAVEIPILSPSMHIENDSIYNEYNYNEYDNGSTLIGLVIGFVCCIFSFGIL
jgi:hypothetical protein